MSRDRGQELVGQLVRQTVAMASAGFPGGVACPDSLAAITGEMIPFPTGDTGGHDKAQGER